MLATIDLLYWLGYNTISTLKGQKNMQNAALLSLYQPGLITFTSTATLCNVPHGQEERTINSATSTFATADAHHNAIHRIAWVDPLYFDKLILNLQVSTSGGKSWNLVIVQLISRLKKCCFTQAVTMHRGCWNKGEVCNVLKTFHNGSQPP